MKTMILIKKKQFMQRRNLLPVTSSNFITVFVWNYLTVETISASLGMEPSIALCIAISLIHTDKSFQNLIRSTRKPIVFTIFISEENEVS